MKRTFLAALAAAVVCVAVAADQAEAQVVAAPAGGLTLLMKDGTISKIGDVFADVEIQFPMDSQGKHVGGLVALYGAGANQGDFGGLGLRYYYHGPQLHVAPGLGVCGYVIGDEFDGISQTSIVVGPELMLQVPLTDDPSDTVTAFAGIYPSAVGDSFTLVKFGLRASLR
jgi:hypothetical protein